jgi:Bacterial membrane protein YfhO
VRAPKPSLVAAAIYGALALLMFAPGLWPGRMLSSSDQLWATAPWAAHAPPLSQPQGANPEHFDVATQFEPFLEHTRATLPHLPLWDPYIMAGRPFIGNGQSAVFSPFSLPTYVLPKRPAPALTAALKLFVAGFGTFLLARALGIGFAGALLAGLVYGFGQSTVDWVKWPETSVRVLLPWTLLSTECVIRSRARAVPAAGLAAVIALVYLGGHPETSYYVLALAAAYALFRLTERWRAGEPPWRPAGALGLSLIGGTALAAIAIAPFVELLLHSSDLELRELFGRDRIPSEHLLAVVLPTYWGRPTQTELLSRTLMLNHAFYAGAIPLLLAAVALTRPTPRRAAAAVLAIGALCATVGLEPFFSVAQALPGTARTDRLVFPFLLAVALLAGAGLEDLMRLRLPALRRRAALALAALSLCLPFVYVLLADGVAMDRLADAARVAWRFSAPAPGLADTARADVIHLAALLEWLPVAAAGAAIVALRAQRRIGATLFAALALVATAGDLCTVSMGSKPAVTVPQAVQPATGATRFLQSHRPTRFVGLAGSDLPSMLPPLSMNVSMRYGLQDARGYDFPIVERYTYLFNHTVNGAFPAPSFYQFHVPVPDDRALRGLGLMSVGYLLEDPRSPPLTEPALALVYNGPDARVYRNRHALPRAFLVSAQRTVVSGDQALAAVASPSFDGRRTAITEERVGGLGAGAGAPGSAAIISYQAERVVVRAHAARPALLVLTDTHFPGWRAEVDGHEVPIHRADYLFRAVRVPAGEHEVVFEYEPSAFRIGAGVSALALLGLVATALVGWRRT